LIKNKKIKKLSPLRIAEMKTKAIEATPVINGQKVDVDRRFRRI